MERRLLKGNSLLLVILLTFSVLGCTHTTTQPPHDNTVSQILIDPSSQQPDLISPLLSESLSLNNTAAYNDHLIWQHLENKFELTELYNHPRVTQQKEKFLNDSTYIANVTKRSQPFIHFVMNEIITRQMPAELAILPIIESGYHPRARSHAKAEGLWQIMPYTARDLGLKRSIGYDGRHDVHASTLAALDYLNQMYNKFDKDWLLALAAYNAGPQRVKRALKKHANNKFSKQDNSLYWDLRLPRETREYVPKILALCSIIKDQDHNDSTLHPIENIPYLETIKLSKRISPAKLIQATSANEKEIKLLNPAIRNLNTPIPAGYYLMVPKGDAEFLSLAIDNLPEAPQPKWLKHNISRGESLGVIARRYGTNIKAIREANNIRSNKIVAGKTLLIPLYSSPQKQSIAQVSPKSKSAMSKVKTPISHSTDTPYMYVVAMGDSFWKIANRNNTTVKRLFEINGRNADQPLQPGETILVD